MSRFWPSTILCQPYVSEMRKPSIRRSLGPPEPPRQHCPCFAAARLAGHVQRCRGTGATQPGPSGRHRAQHFSPRSSGQGRRDQVDRVGLRLRPLRPHASDHCFARLPGPGWMHGIPGKVGGLFSYFGLSRCALEWPHAIEPAAFCDWIDELVRTRVTIARKIAQELPRVRQMAGFNFSRLAETTIWTPSSARRMVPRGLELQPSLTIGPAGHRRMRHPEPHLPLVLQTASAPNPSPPAWIHGIVERDEQGFLVLSRSQPPYSRRILFINVGGGRTFWMRAKTGLIPANHLWSRLECLLLM